MKEIEDGIVVKDVVVDDIQFLIELVKDPDSDSGSLSEMTGIVVRHRIVVSDNEEKFNAIRSKLTSEEEEIPDKKEEMKDYLASLLIL